MHCWTHRVQYFETDRMDLVHHSNYLRWFEECRVDYLEAAGLPFASLERAGLFSPVLEANCRYHRGCTFGDTVDVTAALTEFGRVRFTFCYRVCDHATGALLAEGRTVHCFTDGRGRPLALQRRDPVLADRFAQMCARDSAAFAAQEEKAPAAD